MGRVFCCRWVFVGGGQCVFWQWPSLSIYNRSWITGFIECQLTCWVSCMYLVVADKAVVLWSQNLASWDFSSKAEKRNLDLGSDIPLPLLQCLGTPDLECTILELETIYQQFITLSESLESVLQTFQLLLCLCKIVFCSQSPKAEIENLAF